MSNARTSIWLGAAVVLLLTLAVYGQTVAFNFVEFDDQINVYENPDLRALDREHVQAIWSRPTHPLYIPLTETLWALLAPVARWHAPPLDVKAETFGYRPSVFHFVSLCLHLLNVGLVLVILKRRLGLTSFGAAMGGALFAVHPVQVESVAWVTAQRDLLSAFCQLLAVNQGLAFLARRRWRDWLVATGAFVLALLAKISAISLAGMMMIMAMLWRSLAGSAAEPRPPAGRCRFLRDGAPFAPWIGVAVPMVLVNQWVIKRNFGEPPSLGPGWFEKAASAMDALTFYMSKVIWPTDLSAFYDRTYADIFQADPYGWHLWCPLLLGALLACLPCRRIALALFGLYCVAFVAVLKLATMSGQELLSVADRYAYVAMLAPAIGFGLCSQQLVTLGREAWSPAVKKPLRAGLAATLGIIIVALAWAAHSQANYWRSSLPLFERGLALNQRSWSLHYAYAAALRKRGRYDEARSHYEVALALRPTFAMAHFDLGLVYKSLGQADLALQHYQEALRSAPDYAPAMINIGSEFFDRADYDKALDYFQQAVAAAPQDAQAHFDLGMARYRLGDLQAASESFARSARLNPDSALTHRNRGILEARLGRMDNALQELRAAVILEPASVPSQVALARILVQAGLVDEARAHYRVARQLDERAAAAAADLSAVLGVP